MRIAFIGQKGIPAVSGGVETRVEELATRMAHEGHEVFVYARNNYTEKKITEYKGVSVISLPSIPTKNLDTISHTFLAAVHATFQKYDIVHFQAPGPSTLSWIVKLFARKTGLVATFNSRDRFHQKWGWLAQKYLQLGEYLICKIPDKTVVISKLIQKYVNEKYGEETTVITNGAGILHTDKTDRLKNWNLKEGRYIIYIGRLIKHKGVHYLIEAFKQLEDTNKLPNNFKLVIVGGSHHTDDYVKYLKFISRNRENIIFTGSQSGENRKQLLSNAYLFVQPSEAEGLSISLLEAMGCGIAPLVSDIPENLEPLGKAAITFRNKDISDLSNKLAYLLNKPYEVKTAARAARDIAVRNHSWNSITQSYLHIYQELLNKKAEKHHD